MVKKYKKIIISLLIILLIISFIILTVIIKNNKNNVKNNNDDSGEYSSYQEEKNIELSEKDTCIAKLNNEKELTQKEVADLLGISQSYISRIEKKVIKKLGTIIKI